MNDHLIRFSYSLKPIPCIFFLFPVPYSLFLKIYPLLIYAWYNSTF